MRLLINSDFLDGLDVKEAIPRMLAEIERRQLGRRLVNYRLRDARSRRPMIITTNLKLAELKNPPDLAHARIYDRIREPVSYTHLTTGRRPRPRSRRASSPAWLTCGRPSSSSSGLTPAYPKEAEVNSWTRAYSLGDKQLTITDNFSLKSAKESNQVNFLTWDQQMKAWKKNSTRLKLKEKQERIILKVKNIKVGY